MSACKLKLIMCYNPASGCGLRICPILLSAALGACSETGGERRATREAMASSGPRLKAKGERRATWTVAMPWFGTKRDDEADVRKKE